MPGDYSTTINIGSVVIIHTEIAAEPSAATIPVNTVKAAVPRKWSPNPVRFVVSDGNDISESFAGSNKYKAMARFAELVKMTVEQRRAATISLTKERFYRHVDTISECVLR